MAIPKRTQTPGTYFITSGCWEKKRVFQVERNAELLIQTILHYRNHYLLHAFVVMPDHCHLLITPLDISLERAIQYIKGGYSRRHSIETGSRMEVWQKGFTDHRIRNKEEFFVRMEYIHQNPVRARLAEEPSLYAYSSANGQFQLDKTDLSG